MPRIRIPFLLRKLHQRFPLKNPRSGFSGRSNSLRPRVSFHENDLRRNETGDGTMEIDQQVIDLYDEYTHKPLPPSF